MEIFLIFLARDSILLLISVFFTVCNSCLLRDFDNILGQSIIRACITLAKYKMLSK